MLTTGQTLSVTIEKPAVGGRMIARVNGQIVLVSGAVPGERVQIRIDRIGKGVALADTLMVEEGSPDRRIPAADPACGGCLYAHIAYPRQLEIKSLVIADAFGRIGRIPLSRPVEVAASPSAGYRMRARLHYRGGRLGFVREGTHEVCDARATGQLLAATSDLVDQLQAGLSGLPEVTALEIDIAENVTASERVVHLELPPGAEGWPLDRLSAPDGISGLTLGEAGSGGVRVLVGSAYVTDRLGLDDREPITIRRHVTAFFQGNRHLLRDLVIHVSDQIPIGSKMLDLYAGGGLFAIATARRRGAQVTAVEGDRTAAEDLTVNAANASGVQPVHQSVEAFVRTAPAGPDVVLVDPPRTGLSRDALQGLLRLRGRRVVYVSCDVATLARDARHLLDAGYVIVRIDGFDLFPNTPHVEAVVVFER
ncbi:MAG: TRAM domain-containing protein [Acidobacteriota bacterium]